MEIADGRGRQARRIDFPERELVVLAEGDWRGFRSAACAKEPETAAWLREVIREGDVLYDIGACAGSYALIAAALGAEVHAFEPAAANFWQLQQNVWLNGLEGLHAWPVALTAHTGPLQFELSSLEPGSASHRVKAEAPHPLPGGLPDKLARPQRVATGAAASLPQRSERVYTQAAAGFALDDFIALFRLPAPAHMKIDVDGHETPVLEGARETLRGVSTAMVEADLDSAPSVTAILSAAGLEQEESWPRSGRYRNYLFRRP